MRYCRSWRYVTDLFNLAPSSLAGGSIQTAALTFLSLTLFCGPCPQALAADQPLARIAIIIDDLGYKLVEGKRAINLASQVTLAIIPFSPHAKKLARFANDNHKEVLLHAPMTPMTRQPWEAGLASNMNKPELFAAVDAMLSEVPGAKGLNNHGGSRFTQDRQRMVWLMMALKDRDLFFIDSRTTAATTGMETAHEANIPYNSRDVFLDNDLNEEAIVGQLDKLVAIAVKNGQAIAIGHPHRTTLDVLETYLPLLSEQGVEIVNASVLLKNLPSQNETTPIEIRSAPTLALKPEAE